MAKEEDSLLDQTAVAPPEAPVVTTLPDPKNVRRRKIVDGAPPEPPKPEDTPRVVYADEDEPEVAKPEPKPPIAEAKVEVETPKEPEFPAELLSFGAEHGLDADDVKAFGTPEKAYAALVKIDRKAAARVQPPPKEPEKKIESEAEFDPLVFDKEEYPSEVRGLAKYAKQSREENKNLKEKFTAVEAMVQRLEQAEQGRQRDTIRRQMDAAFNDLPEYVHIFGEGEGNRHAKDSKELKARQEIADQMGVLHAGFEAMKMPVPPLKDLMKMAARMKHGDGTAQAEPPQEKPTKQVERERDDRGQFIARATPRDTSLVGFPQGSEEDSLL